MSAYVALLRVHLHFPEAGSLKAKRAELQSVKAQLHGRHGLTVAEVEHQELWQRSTLASLKRFNEDVREVASGFECGIVLANFQDVKEGDVLEAFETRKVERELA